MNRILACLLIIVFLASFGLGCSNADAENKARREEILLTQVEIRTFSGELVEIGIKIEDHYENLSELYDKYEGRTYEWMGEVVAETVEMINLTVDLEELEVPDVLLSGEAGFYADRHLTVARVALEFGIRNILEGLEAEEHWFFEYKTQSGIQYLDRSIEYTIELLQKCREYRDELQEEYEKLY